MSVPRATSCIDCSQPVKRGRSRCPKHYNESRLGRTHGRPVEPMPDGHRLRGVSTLVDADGQIKAQWIKTDAAREEWGKAMLDAMSKIAHRWKGKATKVKKPKQRDADLLAVYPMGDPHIGMRSWAPEAGNNFDLDIAERNLCGVVDRLVDLAPPAKQALVVSVGDFFHADSKSNATTAGTPVDVDGRWPKVLAVGIRIMRRIVDRALEKHDAVRVICETGNHDWHMSLVLATCLAQFYEREPRVTVDTSPMNVHMFRFGNVLICTTHGDKLKLLDLDAVMACDYPQEWAATKFRYWLTGDKHHDVTKELRGSIVRIFRTLAPQDAWHRGQGYRAGQDMKVLVMHRDHGLVNEHTVGISQLEAA